MRILVTGHRGFIGQNMVNALSDHELMLFEWGDKLPDVTGLDWVIHFGAISSTTETDVEKVMKQNYDFSKWLLHECAKHGVGFQYSSSASVYGSKQDFREDAPKSPSSPYAWSKYFFDKYVQENVWDNVVQGFRYFNVHGPHEDHKGDQASPQHKFTQQAKTLGVIKLFENSHQYLRDFVPVETVVDVHQKFLNINQSGLWNVGTGKATSFETVAREIAAQHHADIQYIPMPTHLQSQYQTYTCADVTNLLKYYDL